MSSVCTRNKRVVPAARSKDPGQNPRSNFLFPLGPFSPVQRSCVPGVTPSSKVSRAVLSLPHTHPKQLLTTHSRWLFQANVILSSYLMEKTLDRPLDCKEMKPVHPKGRQFWMFIGRTDAEAPSIWPLDEDRLTGNDPDPGKDWRQEEKGTTEDEMVGWQHWLHGHGFEQSLEGSEGQGSLACCSP